ncbi:MAG: DUF4339 domain-containing protein [Verrucomicrobia bacterium]|nr:DUF4339 domain-containing protein [Verrucomicrobiota bacterium]
MQLGILDGPVVFAFSCVCCAFVTIATGVIAIVMVRKKSAAPIATPPPPPGARVFQFARDGKIVGSFAENAVAALIASGHIKADDDFWSEGMPIWQKVSTHPSWK